MIHFRRVPRSEYFQAMTPGWILGVIFFVGAVLSAFFFNRASGWDITVCPLSLAAGIPCPLCGGTTASLLLAGGDVRAAVMANPLVTGALLSYALWCLLWLGFGIRAGTRLPSPFVAALILLLLALNWVYILTK